MSAGGDDKPPALTPQPTMLTVDELAKRWKMHRSTIYAAIEKGEIKAVRVGRSVRVSRSHVEFLENNPTPPTKKAS